MSFDDTHKTVMLQIAEGNGACVGGLCVIKGCWKKSFFVLICQFSNGC